MEWVGNASPAVAADENPSNAANVSTPRVRIVAAWRMFLSSFADARFPRPSANTPEQNTGRRTPAPPAWIGREHDADQGRVSRESPEWIESSHHSQTRIVEACHHAIRGNLTFRRGHTRIT